MTGALHKRFPSGETLCALYPPDPAMTVDPDNRCFVCAARGRLEPDREGSLPWDSPHRINRILWNKRPNSAVGYDKEQDIDEIVLHNVTIHVEQMDSRVWWLGVYLPDGDAYWMGNFSCDSRGRMRFSEQEQHGFEWDEDDTHEHPDPAEQETT